MICGRVYASTPAINCAESGEANATADRHLDYCLTLADYAEANNWGRGQIPAFDKIETELANVRAALNWSLHGGDPQQGLLLSCKLCWFITERNHAYEWLGWMEQLLEATPTAPAQLRAYALQSSGAMAGILDDQRSRDYCLKAIELARTHHDEWNLALSGAQSLRALCAE